MKPIIALIGRPNVGKSTLFNLLTNKKDSLVGNYPRLTRDKKYGNGQKGNIKYTIIDTGGIDGHEKGLEIEIAKQSFSAIQECNIVFFIMDAREGLSFSDILINNKLRLLKKEIYFILNKTEGLNCNIIKNEFYSLGINKLYAVSATNNLGINNLFKKVSLSLSKNYEKLNYLNNKYFISKENYKKKITIAVVGCKNSGKSTLINNFIKKCSLLSSNQPGTTIENIYNTKIFNKNYLTIVDTAGFSKNKNKNEIEKASINKIFQAIKESNILVLVIDINKNISKQDLYLVKEILKKGKFLVIVINKCDSFNKKKIKKLKKELILRISFIYFIDIYFISSFDIHQINNLFKNAIISFLKNLKKIKTNKINKIMHDAINHNPPELINKKPIKLKYAHVINYNPFTIVIHGNRLKKISKNYQSYLLRHFYKYLNIKNISIKLLFKNSINPFNIK